MFLYFEDALVLNCMVCLDDLKVKVLKTTMAYDFNPHEGKSRHASYLFNEMSKFQKCGILCDVTVPGQLHLVQAHRVVLASAYSSEGENPTSPMKLDSTEDEVFGRSDDVSWLDEAYSSIRNDQKSNDQLLHGSGDSVQNRLGALDNLRRQHFLCDVTLETDCYKCDAHKVVLAACSDYFRAMFTSSMKEQSMDTIPLQGIDSSYLKRLLDFIYSGELPIDGWEDALELLEFGVFFQTPPLIEHCCSYLISNISSDTACYMLHAGRELALETFHNQSFDFLHDHFLELNDCNAPVNLVHADDLLRLLESEQLGRESNAQSELAILKIVLRWLLHHQSSLDKSFEDKIVSSVRFPLITTSNIMTSCREIIDEFSHLDKSTTKPSFSKTFRKHLSSALFYHNQLFQQPLLQNKSTNLRVSNKTQIAIDGVLASSAVRMPSNCKFIAKDGLHSANEPIRDPFHSVVELNGFVYVIGGTRQLNEGYSDSVFRYDPRLDSCIEVASMQEPRGDFVAVRFEDSIFVFGGRNRSGAMKNCEKYNLATNEWTYIAALPEELYMAAGVVSKGKVYISGGFNNYETVRNTFCYDPTIDTWTRVASSMMSERGYHVMIEGADERLWAIGGIDNPFSGRNVWEVEAFDVNTHLWSYVGQVLPVKLLLSTMRLNVFLNCRKHICISAVTYPEKFSRLEYDSTQRMWREIKECDLTVNLNLKVSSEKV